MSLKHIILAAGALACLASTSFAAEMAPLSKSVVIVPVTAQLPASTTAQASSLGFAIAMINLPVPDIAADGPDTTKLDPFRGDKVAQFGLGDHGVAPLDLAATTYHAIVNDDANLRLDIALDVNAIQAPASSVDIATAVLGKPLGSSSGGGMKTAQLLASADIIFWGRQVGYPDGNGIKPDGDGAKLPGGGQLHNETSI